MMDQPIRRGDPRFGGPIGRWFINPMPSALLGERHLAIKGRPVNVIQGLLGHKSIATTGIYTELAANELLELVGGSEANMILGDVLAGRSE